MLSTTILYIPVLVSLGGVVVCDVTWGTSGLACRSDAHVLLIVLSSIAGVTYTVYCLLGEYIGVIDAGVLIPTNCVLPSRRCMRVYIHTGIHTCIRTYIHTCVRTYACLHRTYLSFVVIISSKQPPAQQRCFVLLLLLYCSLCCAHVVCGV